MLVRGILEDSYGWVFKGFIKVECFHMILIAKCWVSWFLICRPLISFPYLTGNPLKKAKKRSIYTIKQTHAPRGRRSTHTKHMYGCCRHHIYQHARILGLPLLSAEGDTVNKGSGSQCYSYRDPKKWGRGKKRRSGVKRVRGTFVNFIQTCDLV